MRGNKIKDNLTVPNALSLLRIALTVPLAVFILQQNFPAAAAVLLLSALSDMLDGFIARHFDCVTPLGKLLDPVADKMTLIAVVLSLCFVEEAVAWFAGLFLAKEILMLSGGLFLLVRRIRPPAAKWYGKAATVIFYFSVGALVLLRAGFGYSDRTLTLVLLSVTAAAMLFAAVRYARIFFRLLKNPGTKGKKGDN